jgi:hypothetical protein
VIRSPVRGSPKEQTSAFKFDPAPDQVEQLLS